MVTRDGRPRAVLPIRALAALAGILAVALAAAFLAEREIRFLSLKGMLPSAQWEDENATIGAENYLKMKGTGQAPLVRTIAYAPPESSPHRRRILVIGDSYVWGDGIANLNLTWWRQLQWELERRGYHDVDVVAAGLNGASTQDQFGWLRGGLLESTRPDAIVFGYVTNDPQMKGPDGKDLVRQLVLPPTAPSGPEGLMKRAFPGIAYLVGKRREAKAVEREVVPGDGFPYNVWELKLIEGENFRQYGAMLDNLAQFLRSTGTPHAFVTLPVACDQAFYDVRHDPVRTRFEQAGLAFHDLAPRYLDLCRRVGATLAGMAVNPANGHPGARATHFYAVEVADLLERRHASALGAKSAARAGRAVVINDWIPAVDAPPPPTTEGWTFAFPADQRRWLRMPVDEPHVLLSFDRPVALRSVRVAVPGADHIGVWVSRLDPLENFEEREALALGRINREAGSLEVPAKLRGARFTSLRIAVPAPARPYVEVVWLDAAAIGHQVGHAYAYALPALEAEASHSAAQMRSQLVLLEDGRALPRANAVHDDIRKLGGGRFSHWQRELIFSTSDGSDPRTNGRRYVLARPQTVAITVAVEAEGAAGAR